MLELVAGAHALVHLALEEAGVARPVDLGAAKCQIGILKQLVRLVAVRRADRNADADGDRYRMIVKIERRAEHGTHALDEGVGDRGRFVGNLKNDELVATDARHHIGAIQTPAQSLRDPLQQRVADRRPERIVDLLEAVDLEQQHDEEASLQRVAGKHLLHTLAQLHPVRQIGERIVARHVRQLRFDAPQARDVIVRRHPSAALQGLVRDGDDAAVAQLVQPGVAHRLARRGQALVEIGFGVVTDVQPLGDAALDDLAERRARASPEILRQPVHFDVAVVADEQLLVLVEHAQALGHLGQCRIEQPVLLAQLGVATIERRQGRSRPAREHARILSRCWRAASSASL